VLKTNAAIKKVLCFVIVLIEKYGKNEWCSII